MEKTVVRQPRTIMFTNRKGGSGKTTSCIGFADCLRRRGARVLVIDLDSQPGNISTLLGADKSMNGTAELLSSTEWFEADDLVQHASVCDVVAADSRTPNGDTRIPMRTLPSNLDKVANELQQASQTKRLKRALRRFDGMYDYILLDTAPAAETLNVNAYNAADDVIIPTDCDVMSGCGIQTIIGDVADRREDDNPRLRIAGILIGNYEGAVTVIDRDFAAAVRGECERQGVMPAPVFAHTVRHAKAVKESHALGVTVMDLVLRPTRRGGTTIKDDFEAVVDEYLACLPEGE